MDIEKLRQQVKTHRKYRLLAASTGIPYHTLCKFADGRTSEPRYSNLLALQKYFSEQEAA